MSRLKKPAFEKQYLDEENRPKQDIVPIRLNEEDREVLDFLKLFWNTPQDSTAMKWTTEWAKNVLQGQFPAGFAKRVHSEKRNKLL